jgi:hypothetical protein
VGLSTPAKLGGKRKRGESMRAAFSLLGLVIVVAIIWFVIKAQYSSGPAEMRSPTETIDIVGVKGDLIAIGQAERLYLASHGSYASVDQLQQEGSITFGGSNRRAYNYTADVDGGQHFKITAAPADASKSTWPTFTVDENMEVATQ